MRWDFLAFSSRLWICCIIFSIMTGFLFWFCSMQVILLLHLFPSLVFVVELKPWSWIFEEMLHVSLVPIFFYLLRKPRGHMAWPTNGMYGNMDTYFCFFSFFYGSFSLFLSSCTSIGEKNTWLCTCTYASFLSCNCIEVFDCKSLVGKSWTLTIWTNFPFIVEKR
jgi:hypothetical protein